MESTEEKREAQLRAETRTDYILFQQEQGEYSGLSRLWPVYTYRFDTRPGQTAHTFFIWPALSGLGWGEGYSDVTFLLLTRFRTKRSGNVQGHIAHVLYTGSTSILWPIYRSTRDGNKRSLRIFPLIWWRRDGERSATTILPLLVRHERQGTRRCLRVLYLLKIPLSS